MDHEIPVQAPEKAPEEKTDNIGKPKKVIKTSTGLIAIFAAAVIFIGGAFTYWYYNDPNSYDTSKDATQVAKISNINTNSSETADWKIYINTDYGFSFKYPPKWEIDINEHSLINTTVQPLFEVTPALTGGTQKDNFIISVYSSFKALDTKGLGITSLADYLNKYTGSNVDEKQFFSNTQSKLASKQAYQAEWNPGKHNNISGTSTFIEVDNGEILEFNNYGHLGTVETIKNTFSLFTPTPVGSNKSFVNYTCGFSFNYPNDWLLYSSTGHIITNRYSKNISLSDAKKNYSYAYSAWPPIQINCAEDTSGGDVDKYWTNKTRSSDYQKNIISIEGRQAYKITPNSGGNAGHSFAVIFNNGYVIEFYNDYPNLKDQDPDGDIIKIYDQVMESVKFTK